MLTLGKDENQWMYVYVIYRPPALFLISLTFTSVNFVKVLGEGGFSFMYLIQDEHSRSMEIALSAVIGAAKGKKANRTMHTQNVGSF